MDRVGESDETPQLSTPFVSTANAEREVPCWQSQTLSSVDDSSLTIHLPAHHSSSLFLSFFLLHCVTVHCFISLTPDPSNSHMEFGPKAPICTGPQKSTFPRKATICDPAQRTVNTGATCGSTEDYFFFSPWRAPGSAPTIDPCGTAGGRIPGQGDGGFGAQFQNTTHAKVGDIGSKLPHTPTGVTWTAGVNYEVAWTLQANHGVRKPHNNTLT